MKRTVRPDISVRALKGLRLGCGLLFVFVLGTTSGHHHGHLASTSHCAVCHFVGLELDAHTDLPQEITRQDEVAVDPPPVRAEVPEIVRPLPHHPRAPPFFV